jgi:hypothetical protein
VPRGDDDQPDNGTVAPLYDYLNLKVVNGGAVDHIGVKSALGDDDLLRAAREALCWRDPTVGAALIKIGFTNTKPCAFQR